MTSIAQLSHNQSAHFTNNTKLFQKAEEKLKEKLEQNNDMINNLRN